MISENDRKTIIGCARKFKVGSVFLFGSSLDKSAQARDIDIGIKGIAPGNFFKFYAELIKNLSKPVDVVDLSGESLFNKLVEKKGVNILG